MQCQDLILTIFTYKMKRFYLLSLFCGIMPIFVGVLVFLVWYFFRLDFLLVTGLFVIYGGIAIVIVGMIFLIMYEVRYRAASGRFDFKKGIISAGIMIANIPIAIFVSALAIGIMTQYTLTVLNDSGTNIQDVVVMAPNFRVNTGDIPAGEIRVVKLHFQRDGELTFEVHFETQSLQGNIEGYVTNGMGGRSTLIINKNKYRIEKNGVSNQGSELYPPPASSVPGAELRSLQRFDVS